MAKRSVQPTNTDAETGRAGPSRSNQTPTADTEEEGRGCFGVVLIGLSWVLCVLFFPIALCKGLRIMQEYERAIIFRLGRIMPDAQGPGLVFVLPCTDELHIIDLRTVSHKIPSQKILTKDSVTVTVDAVVFHHITKPKIAAMFGNVQRSVALLAQTTLRHTLGTKTLSEILLARGNISRRMQTALAKKTRGWGLTIERVEIKDVSLPKQMQRAMAAEAEASRQARAKVISAEGEQKASRVLKEAADVINQSPAAIQLRYLQTLKRVSTKNNSTIAIPFPPELLKGFIRKMTGK